MKFKTIAIVSIIARCTAMISVLNISKTPDCAENYENIADCISSDSGFVELFFASAVTSVISNLLMCKLIYTQTILGDSE